MRMASSTYHTWTAGMTSTHFQTSCDLCNVRAPSLFVRSRAQVQTVSSVFGADPPLFARPRSSPMRLSEYAGDVRVNVAQATTSFIQGQLGERLCAVKAEMNAELQAQRRLRRMTVDIATAGRTHTATRKGTLQGELQSADTMCIAFKASRRLQAQVPTTGDSPRVEPAGVNPLTFIDALSESSAIEDALYELDCGLRDCAVNLDDFLREARRLSNSQFLKKARITKVHGAMSRTPPPTRHH